METIQYPCGRDVIERVLPHRDPFVWVSRVLECEPGASITAELDVDPELPLFAGHFPGHPVLPGVIIMEALAQTASFCALVGRDEPGVLGFFAGIDKAKFRHQVQPGDVLTEAKTGYPQKVALSNSLGFGGHNAVLAISPF